IVYETFGRTKGSPNDKAVSGLSSLFRAHVDINDIVGGSVVMIGTCHDDPALDRVAADCRSGFALVRSRRLVLTYGNQNIAHPYGAAGFGHSCRRRCSLYRRYLEGSNFLYVVTQLLLGGERVVHLTQGTHY